MDSETRAYLDTALEGLRLEIRAGAVETAGLRRDLRREMRETAEETRRHFDVVAESILTDVRAVAEGVGANSEAIERLGTELRAEMESGWRSPRFGSTSTGAVAHASQSVSRTTLKP